ncbi:MAG: hypothetical protein MJ014_04870, partial [Methanocorpusculum sp.]|nr:hypothetical protein [Methanocorpusculum sp.]
MLRTISGDDCREIHTLLFGGANAPLPTRATTTGTTNSTPTSAAASVGGPKYVEDDEEPAVSDEVAINIIIKSTPKGRKLWAGDTSGYTSGSEADMALMCLLARATAYDEATYNLWQMVRLFLQSGLGKRDKSQKRPDYIKLTATNAIKYVYTKEREKGVETGGICKKEHTTRVEKKKPPEPEVICAGEISQNPQKMRMTMDDIIYQIASIWGVWTCAVKEKKKDQTQTKEAENPQNDVVKTQKEEKKQPPKYTIKLNRWYAAWHAYTRLAKSTDRRNGYYWFDGVEWHLDPEGEDILTAMLGVLTATGVQTVKGWNALMNIVALREGTLAYPPTGHVETAGIVCADGQILQITSTGVRSRMAAPEMEVWMSVLNVRGADIDPEISGMRLEEVWQKHPDWLRMMDACDEPADTTHTHARLWATVAGYVLYAAHCIQGSGWPRLETMMWLMDDHIGNTGKTTHARQLFEAFGTLATHLNWGSVLTKPVYDGDLTDIVLGWADEAGDGELRDTGVFKSLLSGTGSFKVLYRDVKPQSRPLVMVCTANHPPRIAKKEMQDPIKRRIQTAVYTVHHPPQSSHGCSDEEAYRALIDCGIVVCRDIMFAVSQHVPIRNEEGSGVWPDGTDDRLHVPGTPVLPYASSYEDTDRALDRVSWVDILTEAMAPRSGATIGLRQLRISLISWLRLAGRLGDDDTERPRELRTDEAFKIRRQNWSLKIRTDDVDHPRDVWATITVREQTSTAR